MRKPEKWYWRGEILHEQDMRGYVEMIKTLYLCFTFIGGEW